jgi:hypothetical protein
MISYTSQLGSPPHTRVYKEDIPSNMLATLIGMEPMPTQFNG